MMVPGTASANFADNALLDANVPTGAMSQYARRRRIHDAFAPRSLAGMNLGSIGTLGTVDPSCPDSAPYSVPGWPGRCSNVEAAAVSNPIVDYASAPVTDTGITQQNSEARFGLQVTQDRATQERLAAEAESQGAAQGYQVSCDIVENYAPAQGGLPGFMGYQAVCTVNGNPGQSAALLLRPGGWDIARVESNLPASTYHAPVVSAPSGGGSTSTQQSQAQGGGNAQTQQYQTGGPLQMNPNSQGQTYGSGGGSVAPSGPAVISGAGFLSTLTEQPIVLVGIAAVVFLMMRGK